MTDRAYAMHDGIVISNVVKADSSETAETVTGLAAIETIGGEPWIGWTLHGDEWRPPMPEEGMWEWDANAGEWVEVTPEPDPAVE